MSEYAHIFEIGMFKIITLETSRNRGEQTVGWLEAKKAGSLLVKFHFLYLALSTRPACSFTRSLLVKREIWEDMGGWVVNS